MLDRSVAPLKVVAGGRSAVAPSTFRCTHALTGQLSRLTSQSPVLGDAVEVGTGDVSLQSLGASYLPISGTIRSEIQLMTWGAAWNCVVMCSPGYRANSSVTPSAQYCCLSAMSCARGMASSACPWYWYTGTVILVVPSFWAEMMAATDGSASSWPSVWPFFV